ncbi:carboxypeptidase-like regulatory domain-containing protein [Tenacibaculum sp. nBUS_03]|uniref:carboxypeptidase-like regulatory domain-containing protein n=1 Tax=Tenacibaculum sp. nBUS_03 TaxID=3395320 RepID=UPI003EBEC87C
MNKVTGKIVDKISKTPIHEAVVLLKNEKLALNDIAQLSDENGKFEWVDLEVGEYTIQIISELYTSKVLTFICTVDSVLNFMIALER